MKDTKHIRRDFNSVTRVMPLGWDFGVLGCLGGQNKFKHGHVAYQINGDDKQNRMQVKFLSKGQTGDLGVRSKAQISLNIDYIPNFVRFLTNRRWKSY